MELVHRHECSSILACFEGYFLAVVDTYPMTEILRACLVFIYITICTSLICPDPRIGRRHMYKQGLHHEFDMGGGGCGIGTLRGRGLHDITHLPPISVPPWISATLFCEKSC